MSYEETEFDFEIEDDDTWDKSFLRSVSTRELEQLFSPGHSTGGHGVPVADGDDVDMQPTDTVHCLTHQADNKQPHSGLQLTILTTVDC